MNLATDVLKIPASLIAMSLIGRMPFSNIRYILLLKGNQLSELRQSHFSALPVDPKIL
jgi:hypothetical protein